jgi:hypothetical protein
MGSPANTRPPEADDKIVTSIRVDRQIWSDFQRVAEAEKRSAARQMEVLMERAIEELAA